jgi:hypothetical protein
MTVRGDWPVPAVSLLRTAIDYAGLFPPAGFTMPEAVGNHAAYLDGPDAWALGRFVLPVARLAEFEASAGALGRRRAWTLSVLTGADPAADLRVMSEFSARTEGACRIESIEARAATAGEVDALGAFVETGLEVYVEPTTPAKSAAILAAAAAIGARGKIRTGGVTPDAFPPASQVLAFLRDCHRRTIAFKATAGLHHPIRAPYPLTYAAGSACATMYGYLNIMAAAALTMSGAPDAEVLGALEAGAGNGVRITNDTLQLGGGAAISRDAIERMRSFMTSFGSCSFREPLDDLAGLLAA